MGKHRQLLKATEQQRRYSGATQQSSHNSCCSTQHVGTPPCRLTLSAARILASISCSVGGAEPLQEGGGESLWGVGASWGWCQTDASDATTLKAPARSGVWSTIKTTGTYSPSFPPTTATEARTHSYHTAGSVGGGWSRCCSLPLTPAGTCFEATVSI
jgi:hypothetical protein